MDDYSPLIESHKDFTFIQENFIENPQNKYFILYIDYLVKY